jgi:hypothetical protein
MRLAKIIDELNQFEKGAFVKLLEQLAEANGKGAMLNDILIKSSGDELKKAEGQAIAKVFHLLEDEFKQHLVAAFQNCASQFDLLSDIISRDGNAMMSAVWFSKLYEAEIKATKSSVKQLEKTLADGGDLPAERHRAYRVFNACLKTAYENDIANNLDPKITADEQSILSTLAKALNLSGHEVNLLNYTVIPLQKREVTDLSEDLVKLGVVFVVRKTGKVFVADEVVRLLRQVRGREVADKYFKRVLRLLKDPEINNICKAHGMPIRGVEREAKIRQMIADGISFTQTLTEDIHKEGSSVNERKKRINELCDLGLPDVKLTGSTLDLKIQSLVQYFDEVEREDRIGISMEGYDHLIRDLAEFFPKKFKSWVKAEFELQEEDESITAEFLTQFNIKPRDVLEVVDSKELSRFVKDKGIKSRGVDILNVLEQYKDTQNLFFENYEALATRDLNTLKEAGINVKESELGLKFEDITQLMLEELGFNVDVDLKNQVNTKRDKVDILVNLGNSQVMLVECKTVKDSTYNKFSSIIRQLKSYNSLLQSKGLHVVKALIVAPDFSEDFVADAELEYDLSPSLLKAGELRTIHAAFKQQSKHQALPEKLLSHARDVVIDAERVVKSMLR